jgi:hypothetical protein
MTFASVTIYLAMALPVTLLAARWTTRPWTAGAFGGVVAIIASAVAGTALPFDYWLHARRWIVEPLIERSAPFSRIAPSALFHLGAPIGFAIVVGPFVKKKLDSY